MFSLLARLFSDAKSLSDAEYGSHKWPQCLRTIFTKDSFAILALWRGRQFARDLSIPGINRLFRMAQTVLYGIEIGKETTLGEGVYFVHSLGVVIGGTARIGARVKFMGNNTVGTAKNNGYPVIDDDVLIGCGARILGPIRIGKGATIGANAVVLSDVPAGRVAIGIPARVKELPAHLRVPAWEK